MQLTIRMSDEYNEKIVLLAKRMGLKKSDMDFADATLVCLAQDLAIKNIVTFNKKHFSIYRLQGREMFIILP